jgi:hypothetical protein
MLGDHLEWPDAPCCGYPGGCVCPQMERALRAWSGGYLDRPMNAVQREFCLEEIERGTEYGYHRAEYESLPDADVARATLEVWVEYCRDKGLMD